MDNDYLSVAKDNPVDRVSAQGRILLVDDDPDLVCIVMTAFAEAESAIKAVRHGADDYLHKPVAPDLFLRTLDRCLRQQRLAREKEAAITALRESERKYRTIVDSTSDGYWLVDTECRAFCTAGRCPRRRWSALSGTGKRADLGHRAAGHAKPTEFCRKDCRARNNLVYFLVPTGAGRAGNHGPGGDQRKGLPNS